VEVGAGIVFVDHGKAVWPLALGWLRRRGLETARRGLGRGLGRGLLRRRHGRGPRRRGLVRRAPAPARHQNKFEMRSHKCQSHAAPVQVHQCIHHAARVWAWAPSSNDRVIGTGGCGSLATPVAAVHHAVRNLPPPPRRVRPPWYVNVVYGRIYVRTTLLLAVRRLYPVATYPLATAYVGSYEPPDDWRHARTYARQCLAIAAQRQVPAELGCEPRTAGTVSAPRSTAPQLEGRRTYRPIRCAATPRRPSEVQAMRT